MKILHESGLGNAILLAVCIAAAASIWAAVNAQERIDVAEKRAEAAELREAGLVVVLEAKQKELDNIVPEVVTEYVEKRVPGPVRTETVIKWKTKEVPVEVEKIREVVKWLKMSCPEDEEPPADVEFTGSISGTVATFSTKHDNVIAHGDATCTVGPVDLLVDVPFDMDATEAFARFRKPLPQKRHLVSVDYAVDPSSFYDYSMNQFIDGARLRGAYQYTLFPRKQFSVAVGAYVDSDSTGPRLSVWF